MFRRFSLSFCLQLFSTGISLSIAASLIGSFSSVLIGLTVVQSLRDPLSVTGVISVIVKESSFLTSSIFWSVRLKIFA